MKYRIKHMKIDRLDTEDPTELLHDCLADMRDIAKEGGFIVSATHFLTSGDNEISQYHTKYTFHCEGGQDIDILITDDSYGDEIEATKHAFAVLQTELLKSNLDGAVTDTEAQQLLDVCVTIAAACAVSDLLYDFAEDHHITKGVKRESL